MPIFIRIIYVLISNAATLSSQYVWFLLCCRLPPKLGETAKVYRETKTKAKVFDISCSRPVRASRVLPPPNPVNLSFILWQWMLLSGIENVREVVKEGIYNPFQIR